MLSGAGGRGGRRRGAGAAARRARRGRRVRLPAAAVGATIDTLLLGCTHYPLLAAGHRAHGRASGVAIVDSATATASALAELLGDQRPRGAGRRRAARPPTRATAATRGRPSLWRPGDPPPAHDRRRRAFRAIAARLFGEPFPRRRAGELAGCAMTAPDAPAPTGGGDPGRERSGRRVPRRLGARRRRDGRRAPRGAGRARRGLVDWPQVERIAIGRAPRAPGALDAARAAGRRGGLRARRWRASCRALSSALGTPAAGRRRAGRASSIGPAGSAPTSATFALADRQARGRAARPGGAARAAASARPTMALANRWVTTRQLGLPARVHGHARPRPVRPRAAVRRGDARPAPVRRGEHPRDRAGARTSRSGRSGPGSPSTRRPTPSSSRRTPGCGRTSPSAWSASSRCSARTRAGSAARRCAASAGRSAARRGGEHWMERADGRRAARAVPRDPGGDEPARGVQRLRHGRGRRGPGPGRRADQRAVPRAARSSGRRSSGPMLRLTGHGPQDGAVPQGRAVRSRRSPSARGAPALARLWEGPETLPRAARSTSRIAGSRRVLARAGTAAMSPTRPDGAGPGRGPGGVPAAIAAEPDPVGPLPRRATSSGSGPPRPGARIVNRLGRGPRRRPARRRRGHAPRLA